MKNKSILVAFGLLMLTACNLNEELNDSLTGEQAAAVKSAQQSLDYTYSLLQDFETTDNMFVLQEHPSDEMAGPTRGADWDDGGVWRALHKQTWTVDNARVITTYDALHKGLAYSVDVLGASTITPSQKAQATFLEVFYMWNITDLFGQVTSRLPNEIDEYPSIYLTRAESIDNEISLLEAELPNLPDGTAATSNIANKNAGNALLAKLYLNRAVYKATDASGKPQVGPFTFDNADMAKVVSYCDAAMIGRNLQANYFENFAPNNGEVSNELIFTGKNTESNSPNISRMYFMTLHYNQNPSGWNGFVALTDLYNKFDASDPRLTSSITGLTDVSGLKAGLLLGQQVDETGTNVLDRQGNPLIFSQDFALANSTEEKGMRVVKYQPDYNSLSTADNDWVFLRLSDVMLMKAEALFRMGQTGPALTVVNELRTQRGIATLGALSLSDILDERARELYWEGHRRQDQIRFGTFLNDNQEATSKSQDGHTLIFPIPLVPLNANPKLHQNPGY